MFFSVDNSRLNRRDCKVTWLEANACVGGQIIAFMHCFTVDIFCVR